MKFEPQMTPEIYRLVINNSRSMAMSKHKKKPNWVIVMDIFCVGSTMAWNICSYAQIDGDSNSVGQV